jgi:hypothetical protein
MSRPAAVPVGIASLSTPDSERNEAKEATGSVEVADVGSSAALSDPPPMPRPTTTSTQFVAVSPTDPVQNAARPASSSKALDACPEPDACIDQYLWSLYERTPKVDTVKVEERIKVKVKSKGKMRTVVKTLTKYITQDFAWKDPIAAQKAKMSLKDYVIGGMDRGFRRKLYDALRAMDDAGFSPGITSGFRDDYRQELVSGNKAASDSSYHGGSLRGGYGHGLAADLVSVKGETRAERCKWSEILWKWIDAHEKELGIGRPYLDKDPPHVAPIDGKEYADKRLIVRGQWVLEKPAHLSRLFLIDLSLYTLAIVLDPELFAVRTFVAPFSVRRQPCRTAVPSLQKSNPSRRCGLSFRYCSSFNSAIDCGGLPEKMPSSTSTRNAGGVSV